MSLTAFILATALTTVTQTREVFATETAFAKAFADRDKEKFFSYVAKDATFLSGFTTSHGRDEVIASWSRYFEGPQAPFSWGPERVSVSADTALALSTGPVYDTNGNHVGDYISTWRKEKDGTWKIVFDSNGPGPAPLVENAVRPEEGFVTADDGVKLYYRKIGRGPVTLIVPLDNVLFREFRQFADIATVITYDMRNRGRSERAKDESTWTIQQDARDLEAVRRHFKVEKFVPVGYSYLGLMVMLYTLDHPSHVSRIVQLSPGAFRKLPEEAKPEAAGAFEAAMKKVDPNASPRDRCVQFWNEFKTSFVGDPRNAAKFDMSFCELENEQGPNLMPHMAKLFASIDATKLSLEQVRKVRVPVLTIHGTKDRNAPYAGGLDWAKTLLDARIVTVEGAAHAAWLDDPALVFGSIRHFLRGDWPIAAKRKAHYSARNYDDRVNPE